MGQLRRLQYRKVAGKVYSGMRGKAGRALEQDMNLERVSGALNEAFGWSSR